MKEERKILILEILKGLHLKMSKLQMNIFFEIGPNEVITPRKKNKQDKCKRTMVDDESIPIDYEEIIDLDEIHLNHQRKKTNVDNVQEAIVSSEYYSEIPKGSR